MMNEVQEEICKIEAENRSKEILLNVIDKTVRRIIKNEEKANYLIRKLITAFLEALEEDHKEENLSIEEKRKRLKVRALAIRKRDHDKYTQERFNYRKAREVETKRNKKIALETLGRLKEGEERKEKKKETHDEVMKRLLRTSTGRVEEVRTG